MGEHSEVLDHAGLLFDRSPGTAGLSFVQSSDDFQL
jgi:hypothetical protein